MKDKALSKFIEGLKELLNCRADILETKEGKEAIRDLLAKATYEPQGEKLIKQLMNEGYKLVSQVNMNGTEFLHFLNKDLEHIGIEITWWQDTETIADLMGIDTSDLPQDEEQADQALMKEWRNL